MCFKKILNKPKSPGSTASIKEEEKNNDTNETKAAKKTSNMS